jgi:hypothetical protein
MLCATKSPNASPNKTIVWRHSKESFGRWHSEHRRLAYTRANGPVRAKADLAHGEWGDCSMKPCCLLANGRLERLMVIANHPPFLSNTTHASPSACRCWQSRVTRAVTRAVCVRHEYLFRRSEIGDLAGVESVPAALVLRCHRPKPETVPTAGGRGEFKRDRIGVEDLLSAIGHPDLERCGWAIPSAENVAAHAEASVLRRMYPYGQLRLWFADATRGVRIRAVHQKRSVFESVDPSDHLQSTPLSRERVRRAELRIQARSHSDLIRRCLGGNHNAGRLLRCVCHISFAIPYSIITSWAKNRSQRDVSTVWVFGRARRAHAHDMAECDRAGSVHCSSHKFAAALDLWKAKQIAERSSTRVMGLLPNRADATNADLSHGRCKVVERFRRRVPGWSCRAGYSDAGPAQNKDVAALNSE